MKSLQNRFLKVCYVPATIAHLPKLLFLLQPLTVLMDYNFDHQVSISPTFYEQLLHQNPFTKKLQTQIVSTQKVRKELWYEKAVCKILVKLTVIPKLFAQLLSAYNLGL